MRKYFKLIIGWTLLLIVAGCKQEYAFPPVTRNLNLLIVEGLINSGTGPTIIRLSRSVNPNDTTNILPEVRAQVTVESESNNSFSLTENAKGEYSSPQLILNNTEKYRLRIKTANGNEYHSEYVPIQQAPLIDSIHWQRKDEAIELYVSTHDAQNKTKYYRWEYSETWEIHSAYFSRFEWNNGINLRLDPESIYYCWRDDTITRIFLGSSARLLQDVISFQPVLSIPVKSDKIAVRYSLFVRQYALTREAYDFWEILKKNTEKVGTLFDPQPSQLSSNIRCVTDPDEPVIGFVSAGTVDEKRIFINRRDVEPWKYSVDCPEKLVPIDSLAFYFQDGGYIPTIEFAPNGIVEGYYGSHAICVDCTLMGSNVKPSFW